MTLPKNTSAWSSLGWLEPQFAHILLATTVAETAINSLVLSSLQSGTLRAKAKFAYFLVENQQFEDEIINPQIWTRVVAEMLDDAFWSPAGRLHTTQPPVRLSGIVLDAEGILPLLQKEEIPREQLAIDSRRAGRPARCHGEAIASVTIDLADLSETELRPYTSASVGSLLRDVYVRLGEAPPNDQNLDRYGSGILRVLRNRQG